MQLYMPKYIISYIVRNIICFIQKYTFLLFDKYTLYEILYVRTLKYVVYHLKIHFL